MLVTDPEQAKPAAEAHLRALYGLTKAEAIKRCENLGLPFASITRPEDLFDDPHLNASGGLVPLDLPNGMKSKSPILPLEMDGRRLGVGHRLPRIGEHTREILLGLGYAEAEIGRLHDEGVVAGPTPVAA